MAKDKTAEIVSAAAPESAATAAASAAPTTTPIVTSAPPIDNLDALEQEAVQKRMQYLESIELVRDNLKVGRFANVPHEYAARNWVFVRFGLKGVHRDEVKASQMRQRGFRDAPPGVRAIGQGFENDGDRALILCAPPSVAQSVLAEKIIATRERIGRLNRTAEKDIESKLRASLPSNQSLHMSLRIGSAPSIDALNNELQAVVRDLPRTK